MQDINFRRHYVRHLPKEVSQQDIIRTLASPLINDGMVVSDFADHVIEREKVFQQVWLLNLWVSLFPIPITNMFVRMRSVLGYWQNASISKIWAESQNLFQSG